MQGVIFLRKNSKRILGVVLCLMMLMLYFPITEVKGADNTVELSVDYLNRHKCWIEAANYLHLGYSQADIAVEIYAHAIADNISYRYLEDTLSDYGSFYVKLLNSFINEVNEHAHVVNLGGDDGEPDRFLDLYHILWKVIYLDDNNVYYTFHSDLNQDKVIDVRNNSNKNGAKIQLHSDNDTGAQDYEILFAEDSDGISWYYIFKKGQFKCLDVTEGKAESGVNVQLFEFNGTKAQQWCIVDAGDGSYYLCNRLGYYMDACGGCDDNGTQIWTYSFNGTSAQKWWLETK